MTEVNKGVSWFSFPLLVHDCLFLFSSGKGIQKRKTVVIALTLSIYILPLTTKTINICLSAVNTLLDRVDYREFKHVLKVLEDNSYP